MIQSNVGNVGTTSCRDCLARQTLRAARLTLRADTISRQSAALYGVDSQYWLHAQFLNPKSLQTPKRAFAAAASGLAG